MVAAVSTAINPKTTANHTNNNSNHSRITRPPLLPSDPDNAIAPPRRPKSREVTSRYMSSSSSSTPKRSQSPSISQTAATPAASTIKRSLSVDPSRRTNTPRPNGNGTEVSNAQKLLITSARSLSVSFQGESYSLQVSRAKPLAPSLSRKGTPERRKASQTPGRVADQLENINNNNNSRPWPGRFREPKSLSRSVDCGDGRGKLIGSEVNHKVVRALQSSMVDNSSNDTSDIEVSRSDSNCDRDYCAASDAESMSSSCNSEGTAGNAGQGQRGPRGIVVPARFWQETNNRLRRQPEPGSPPVTRTVGDLKGPVPPKLIAPKKVGFDSPVSSPKGVVNSRGISPIRSGGALRPASPSKLGTPSATLSPMRGVSPSRMRNGMGAVVSGNTGNLNNMTPSILSFAADIRRGRSGEHRIVEVHLLRILFNCLLQWRFVNARADSCLLAQRLNAEKSLYNASITTSKLQESVRAKRKELQHLRQHLKLISILKKQMNYLEEFELMDQDFSPALSGAIQALQASTLRLPVVGGARVDVQNVKDAISSAVEVMQAMASSVCSSLSKVGEVNSLVAELANVAAKERALLDQCKDLLSTIAAMQVTEFSLRTHLVQQKHIPSSLTTQV